MQDNHILGKFTSPLPLSDWDRIVKPHLGFIESGAEMAARHARALICRPGFTSHAQDELAEARRVLESALASIIAAEATYEAKPAELQAAE